jgi:hypothetical protein
LPRTVTEPSRSEAATGAFPASQTAFEETPSTGRAR